MTGSTDLLGLLRADGDRLAVRFERRYATEVEDLWDAVTAPERLARWLAPVSGDLRAGGRYRLDFVDGDEAVGEVLACVPPERLEVSWEFPGEQPSRVLVRVAAADGGALLVLDHVRLPRAQAAGYGAGWHAHLARLEALAAGRPDAADWDAAFTAALPAYRAQLEAVGARAVRAQAVQG